MGQGTELRPGAGDQLVRLAPLIRPLVELHWVRMVARLNKEEFKEDHLYRHLFGSGPGSFPRSLETGAHKPSDG